jgi:membrane-bound lytic murein transglycosylase D
VPLRTRNDEAGRARIATDRCLRLIAIYLVLALLGRSGFGQSEVSESIGDLDALYETGQELFNAYAPDEVKETIRFPTREEWDEFWKRIETTLQSDYLSDWAWIRPEAERALELLRSIPGGDGYADWLFERLDYLEMAEGALVYVMGDAAPVRSGSAGPRLSPPSKPPPVPAPNAAEAVRTARYIENWKNKIGSRPAPPRAGSLVPRLKPVFRSEGIPPEWVWLAEVESSFNPKAVSPVGAKGLFQFMPTTAERFGMKTSSPDQRTDPVRSARAAAQYLRILYRQLGSWPLALAAYNAGEGRVGRLLKKHNTGSYEGIVDFLPTETQLYVPKVFATVAVREGIDPLLLPPPVAR